MWNCWNSDFYIFFFFFFILLILLQTAMHKIGTSFYLDFCIRKLLIPVCSAFHQRNLCRILLGRVRTILWLPCSWMPFPRYCPRAFHMTMSSKMWLGSHKRKKHWYLQASLQCETRAFPLKCWGMPKSRATSAVYMQQDRGWGQYICSKTGDEGSIYAARQGMKAIYMQQDRGWGDATIITCVTPPYISFIMGLRMFVACPHLLSCCIHITLIPCLAAYILHLLLYFLALSSLHPLIF